MLYTQIMGRTGISLGEALAEAFNAYAQYTHHTELLNAYNLLGDQALVIQ